MPARRVDQPLLIFHDATRKVARAALLPADFKCDAETIAFNGRSFRSIGSGIMFWDYLVAPGGTLLGIVFNKFDIDDSLQKSALLNASRNIDSDEYGYYLRLHEMAGSADIDCSQAFGSTLYESGGECLLYLMDWHGRGYGFDVDTEQAVWADSSPQHE